MNSNFLILIFSVLLCGSSYASIPPSFDCSKAKSTSENLICDDAELSALDSNLSQLHKEAKALVVDQKAFQQATVAAWKLREQNCEDKICLLEWFDSRKQHYQAIIEEAGISSRINTEQAATNQREAINRRTTSVSSTNTRSDPTSKSFVGWTLVLIIFLCVAIPVFFFYKHMKDEEKEKSEKLRALILSAADLMKEIVESHKQELLIRRKQTTITKAYGLIDTAKWEKEKEIFLAQVLAPQLRHFDEIDSRINLSMYLDKVTDDYNNAKLGYSDDMDPYEYEHFVASELDSLGWKTTVTVASGDQGVDVIAEKYGCRLAIQCKLYQNPVGNDAVQQILAGKAFSKAHFAAVVSNAAFTKSAAQIAEVTNVWLLHHDDLARLDKLVTSKSANTDQTT